jgi:amidase
MEMAIPRPTLAQLTQIAEEFGLRLTPDELAQYNSQMGGMLQAYAEVEAMPEDLPKVTYPRGMARRPSAEENPFNAWYVKTEIQGAASGKLKGKRVAVKDNVAVAGVPMMNGASVLEGYVPEIDATVVTRLLDAGAVIAGKAHCEYYCTSGGSHTGSHGPVHNPRRRGYSAGGSSSGSAALLAAGEVDIAIGADQGGSIRMPAAFCGVVGMKPTWGLVPYTGVMPIELTVDHVGPMSTRVFDNALALEAIAGPDGLDPRQGSQAAASDYTREIEEGVHGWRVGVVREGFCWANSEADVDAAVRDAARVFARLGATVEEVGIPLHRSGQSIWTPIINEGATQQMMKGDGFGFNWKGLYLRSLMSAQSAWRNRAHELAPTAKMTLLAGEAMLRQGQGRYYAKAQNVARRLCAAYDDALGRYDLLLMPTVPMKATELPPPDAPLPLYFQRAWEMLANTSPFDVTGHPALQLPCASRGGLPVGMMLVGKHFDEVTLYRAGRAFEAATDWTHS